MAKKPTFKSRLSYITKTLANLEKKGLSTELALRGKTPEQLARTNKGVQAFKYGVKVAKERPSIEKTLQSMNERVKERSLYNLKTNIGKEIKRQIKEIKSKASTDSYNILKNEQDKIPQFRDLYEVNSTEELKKLAKEIRDKPLLKLLEEKTEQMGGNFFDKYFAPLQGDEIADKKIEEIQKIIGDDLGLLNDMMDILISPEFKGDFDSEGNRGGKVHWEDTYSEMNNRLDKLLGMVKVRKG